MTDTTATQALTPKQRQVLDLLNRDVSPTEVARRLKISPSGVYGHMRNIRAAGVEIDNLALATGPAAPAPEPEALTAVSTRATNGEADPAQALTSALESGRERLTAIDAQIDALGTERSALAARLEKLDAALGALA